jgi:hypothetical protein
VNYCGTAKVGWDFVPTLFAEESGRSPNLRNARTLVTELYDSVVLPGVRRPMAVGFKATEIERLIFVDDNPA